MMIQTLLLGLFILRHPYPFEKPGHFCLAMQLIFILMYQTICFKVYPSESCVIASCVSDMSKSFVVLQPDLSAAAILIDPAAVVFDIFLYSIPIDFVHHSAFELACIVVHRLNSFRKMSEMRPRTCFFSDSEAEVDKVSAIDGTQKTPVNNQW